MRSGGVGQVREEEVLWGYVEAYWRDVSEPELRGAGVMDVSLPARPESWEGIETGWDAVEWAVRQEQERLWQHELAEMGDDGEIE